MRKTHSARRVGARVRPAFGTLLRLAAAGGGHGELAARRRGGGGCACLPASPLPTGTTQGEGGGGCPARPAAWRARPRPIFQCHSHAARPMLGGRGRGGGGSGGARRSDDGPRRWQPVCQQGDPPEQCGRAGDDARGGDWRRLTVGGRRPCGRPAAAAACSGWRPRQHLRAVGGAAGAAPVVAGVFFSPPPYAVPPTPPAGRADLPVRPVSRWVVWRGGADGGVAVWAGAPPPLPPTRPRRFPRRTRLDDNRPTHRRRLYQ